MLRLIPLQLRLFENNKIRKVYFFLNIVFLEILNNSVRTSSLTTPINTSQKRIRIRNLSSVTKISNSTTNINKMDLNFYSSLPALNNISFSQFSLQIKPHKSLGEIVTEYFRFFLKYSFLDHNYIYHNFE